MKTTQRSALVASMFGSAVVLLDSQVANVALPAIHKNFGGDLTGLQWVVSGYSLMFSAFLLFGGTIADRMGSKKANRNGVILFVLASILCGVAPSLPVLIFARMLQGFGAALVTPTSLSLIRESYQDSKQRARAIGYWSVGGAAAAAAGPIIGGFLAAIDWRLIFFVNLPVGIIALLALRGVSESTTKQSKFDIPGQITAIIGFASLTFACIEGGAFGFGSPIILSAFALAVVALGSFVRIQATSKNPMLPLELFKSFPLVVSLLIAMVTMAAFYGLVFMQSLYFQQERGYTALLTGLFFLPMTATPPITNLLVARVSEKFGKLAAVVLGLSVMTTGLVVLSMLPTEASVWLVAGLMAAVGGGGAFTVPAIAALILDVAPANFAGIASGVLNTFRQLGGSLGVAIFGTVVNLSAVFMVGLRADYLVVSVILIFCILLALLFMRDKKAAV